MKRNPDRFPEDFMFQLARQEFEVLRYQFGTLKTGRGQHRKYLPFVFSEHGAIMAANVLNSPRAVQMSVFIVRAFLKMRVLLGESGNWPRSWRLSSENWRNAWTCTKPLSFTCSNV